MSSFYHWLVDQKRRDDRVGDLASDASSDEDFRLINGIRGLESEFDEVALFEYLTSMRACANAMDSAKAAVEEWKIRARERGIEI